MHYSIPTAMVALMATVVHSAAIGTPTLQERATLVKRDTICTATMTGVNSEGGARRLRRVKRQDDESSPTADNPSGAQSNIDNTNFGMSISGLNAYFGRPTENSGGGVSITVPGSDYGSAQDVTCSGAWDLGGNAWTECSCNSGPGDSPGAVQKQSIDTDIVSTTTDLCIVEFGC